VRHFGPHRLTDGNLMEEVNSCQEESKTESEKPFLNFMRSFAEADAKSNLFPKSCSVCGRKYSSLADFIRRTHARGHCMEDCRGTMGRVFTMIYRHCDCGNTLVLALSGDAFSFLDSFWEMFSKAARQSGRPLRDLVMDFVSQWELYLSVQHDPQR